METDKVSAKALLDYNRNVVYYVSFVAYAMSHFSRKSYTNVKVQLKLAGVDPILLSQMDTVFMICYAIGSFFSGKLGDTYHAPTIVGIGLVGSGICVFLLAMCIWGDLAHSTYSAPFFFLSIWLFHGLLQSTGGPVNTAIMGNWFSSKNRGYIFGTWTCHQYVGNIVAAVLTTVILNSGGLNWTLALVIPALGNVVWGLVCMAGLPEKPSDIGLTTHQIQLIEDGDRDAELVPLTSSEGMASSSTEGRAPTVLTATKEPGTSPMLPNASQPSSISLQLSLHSISFSEALTIPNVIGYALAFGFFKLVNYAMFFWLPFFLSLHFTPGQSNMISILYDVGMMPGGIIVGYVSDLFGGRRACVIVTFMLVLIPLLFIFSQYADAIPATTLLLLLGCMGVLVGGPNNIITSAVAADLADHPSIRGNSRALGTVTGIINGSGSVIAAMGLLVIGPLQQTHGWTSVWYFLIVCVVIGTCLMAPKVVKEVYYHHLDDLPPAASPIHVTTNALTASTGTVNHHPYQPIADADPEQPEIRH